MKRASFVLAVAVVLPGVASSPEAGAASGFVPTEIPLRDSGLRDLGVTDVDLDGHLDVFTVNHSAPENVLRGRGDGTFTQRIEALNLYQDSRFPTLLHDGPAMPPLPARSVHIAWWRRSGGANDHASQQLVIRAASGMQMGGRVSVFTPIYVSRSRGVELRQRVRRLPSGIVDSSLTFTGKGPATLVLAMQPGLPVKVRITKGARILVGWPPKPAPKGSTLTLFRRDRHGAAWADVIGGKRPEVAFVRGGLRGSASDYPLTLYQELRLFREGAYREIGQSRGLALGGCSSQSVEWVDANTDGALDLSIACKGKQKSKLFINNGGRFVNRAQALGLAIPGLDPLVWIDFDDDGDMDALTGLHGEVLLFENKPSGFKRRVLGAVPARGIRDLALAPISSLTERPEILVVARESSGVIAFGSGSEPTWQGLNALGIPSDLVHASWVDYDNDGDLDLFTVPGGLHERIGPSTFVPAADQPPIPSGKIAVARVAWFDADGDGRRDFLGAFLRANKFPLVWSTSFAMNRVAAPSPWLQIALQGARGNASAIGAVVSARWTGGSVKTRIGAFDTTRHSQGHYRMYLGLGSAIGPIALDVRWPDGTETSSLVAIVDRLVTLRHPQAA